MKKLVKITPANLKKYVPYIVDEDAKHVLMPYYDTIVRLESEGEDYDPQATAQNVEPIIRNVEAFLETDGIEVDMPAEKNEPAATAAPKKEKTVKATAKTKKEKKPKAAKPKKTKKAEGKAVDTVAPEVAVFKRIISLHGKEVDEKVRKKALDALKTLQGAIIEKRIRKTSKYAKEVIDVQDLLISLTKAKTGKTIEIEGIDHLRTIAKSQHRSPKALLMAKLLRNITSAPDIETARTLLAAARRAKSKNKNVVAAINALADYVDGNTTYVEATQAQLEGLAGII